MDLLTVVLRDAVREALVPGVRTLEIAAARALLGAEVPEPDPATVDDWSGRRRAAGWLLLNLLVGGVTALVVLVVVPTVVGFLLARWRSIPPLATGWAAAWAPPAALVLPVL